MKNAHVLNGWSLASKLSHKISDVQNTIYFEYDCTKVLAPPLWPGKTSCLVDFLGETDVPFTAGEDMVICILDSFSVIFIDRLWLGVELFVDPVIGGKTEKKNKRQKFEIILSRYTKEYTVYFCPNIIELLK